MIEDGAAQAADMRRALLSNEEALGYLFARGVSLDAINRFSIGWFDRSKASRYYRRVMFPVRDQYGRVHTFQGRALDKKAEPKYWHASYDKGKALYGLFENAREMVRQSRAVLVEGPLDTTALWQSGLPGVSAFGTAFTPAQACLLRRFVDDVVLWYDPDRAGQAAAVTAFEVLESVGMRRIYFVQSKEDPAALYASGGRKAVLAAVSSAS